MAKLLTSLPAEFKMFRKAFESFDEKLQTKDELISGKRKRSITSLRKNKRLKRI